ncbi:MAG: hypothetical protein JSU90_07710 [Nitrospiraceae bacterium]|nr:MAG: hypothetical protein JSU90_07710 [Nitrospiraceae bacterium]
MIREKEAGTMVQDRFTVKPSGSYEECIALRPGQTVEYDFNASSFVNFNIHYHGEKDLYYPVTNEGVMMGRGMVDPSTHSYFTPEQEYYCLMWENRGIEPVEISYRCTMTDKPGMHRMKE